MTSLLFLDVENSHIQMSRWVQTCAFAWHVYLFPEKKRELWNASYLLQQTCKTVIEILSVVSERCLICSSSPVHLAEMQNKALLLNTWCKEEMAHLKGKFCRYSLIYSRCLNFFLSTNTKNTNNGKFSKMIMQVVWQWLCCT